MGDVTMKKIIYLMMALLMVSSVFAVTRSISGQTITYDASANFDSKTKAYWAIEDTFGAGCNVNTVTRSTDNCGTNCEYSINDNILRLVAYTASSGTSDVLDPVQITVDGSGTCSISGDYAEAAEEDGQKLGMEGGSDTIDLEGNGECNTDADGLISGTCNNCVSQQEFNAFIPIFRADPPNQQVEFNNVISSWRLNPACPE